MADDDIELSPAMRLALEDMMRPGLTALRPTADGLVEIGVGDMTADERGLLLGILVRRRMEKMN